MSWNFDGEGTPLAPPTNNCSNLPEPGTPAWEKRLAAEQVERAKVGVNSQRNATLARDVEAAKKNRP